MCHARALFYHHSMQAIVLAGGLGTRLQALKSDKPKFLMSVGGRPFAEWLLQSLADSGFSNIVLCLGYLAEQVENHLGPGPVLGMQISYSYDGPTLLGTGGALVQALPKLEENFFVLYGDSFLQLDYGKVYSFFKGLPSSVEGVMTVYANDNKLDKSNAEFADGKLVRYDKRNPTSAMRHIDYGASILKRSVVEALPRGEFVDLAQLYTSMVSTGKMVGFEVFSRFYEIGTPESLREADAFFNSRGLP